MDANIHVYIVGGFTPNTGGDCEKHKREIFTQLYDGEKVCSRSQHSSQVNVLDKWVLALETWPM